LHRAAQNGYKDIVKLLLDNDANINSKTSNKMTPIVLAAYNGHEDLIRFLIDRGAELSSIDYLLYNAVRSGYKDLTEIIIKKGANVNSEAWGDAPSFYPVWSAKDDVPRFTDVLELLLSYDANPNAKDSYDWSLLHYTAIWGYTDMTKLLLNKGANLDPIENDRGQTPLHLSAYHGHKADVELLIAHGANANVKDWDDKTPLTLAKENGHTEIVELLKKHGAKE